MEFRITEAEAREMAKLEEDCGCDISAGPDWGIHLDKVMALGLNPGNSAELMLHERNKFVDLLSEQFGNLMSLDEIEEVAASFQMQIQERLANKITK
jgi:hypothetical protein